MFIRFRRRFFKQKVFSRFWKVFESIWKVFTPKQKVFYPFWKVSPITGNRDFKNVNKYLNFRLLNDYSRPFIPIPAPPTIFQSSTLIQTTKSSPTQPFPNRRSNENPTPDPERKKSSPRRRFPQKKGRFRLAKTSAGILQLRFFAFRLGLSEKNPVYVCCLHEPTEKL